MTKQKIKFGHKYFKMPSAIKETILLEVLVCKSEELHKSFVTYDTGYKTGEYALPKGKVLILMLISDTGNYDYDLWTTIRRWTPIKEAYYKGLRGQGVEIEVNDRVS